MRLLHDMCVSGRMVDFKEQPPFQNKDAYFANEKLRTNIAQHLSIFFV